MDPLSLMLASPGFITGIMQLFGAGKQRDPMEEFTRMLDMYQSRFGPQAAMRDATQVYGGLKSSPYGVAGLNNIISGAQQSSNLLNRNLAGAGIAGSGIGQIKRSLAPSVMAGGINNFNSGLFGQSLDTVMNSFRNIMAGVPQGMGRQAPGMGALGFGKGIENTDWRALMNLFRNFGQGGGKMVPWNERPAIGPAGRYPQ